MKFFFHFSNLYCFFSISVGYNVFFNNRPVSKTKPKENAILHRTPDRPHSRQDPAPAHPRQQPRNNQSPRCSCDVYHFLAGVVSWKDNGTERRNHPMAAPWQDPAVEGYEIHNNGQHTQLVRMQGQDQMVRSSRFKIRRNPQRRPLLCQRSSVRAIIQRTYPILIRSDIIYHSLFVLHNTKPSHLPLNHS